MYEWFFLNKYYLYTNITIFRFTISKNPVSYKHQKWKIKNIESRMQNDITKRMSKKKCICGPWMNVIINFQIQQCSTNWKTLHLLSLKSADINLWSKKQISVLINSDSENVTVQTMCYGNRAECFIYDLYMTVLFKIA